MLEISDTQSHGQSVSKVFFSSRKNEDWVKRKSNKRPCFGQSTYCSTFLPEAQWRKRACRVVPLFSRLAADFSTLNHSAWAVANLFWAHPSCKWTTALRHDVPLLIDEVKIHNEAISYSRWWCWWCAWAICFQSSSTSHDLTLKNFTLKECDTYFFLFSILKPVRGVRSLFFVAGAGMWNEEEEAGKESGWDFCISNNNCCIFVLNALRFILVLQWNRNSRRFLCSRQINNK